MKNLEKCVKSVIDKKSFKKQKEVYYMKLSLIIDAINTCSRMITNISSDIYKKSNMNIREIMVKFHPNIYNGTLIVKS